MKPTPKTPESPEPGAAYPLSVLIKPASSRCNLNCSYCFYLEKREIYPWDYHPSMSLETFEAFLRDYVTLSAPHLTFSWQGGEPTLMGLSFFQKVVELQQGIPREAGHNGSLHIGNSIQTNAILLDDEWARFLRRRHFLVGVSLDGPPEFHDEHRRDRLGQGTHAKVMEGIDSLRRHRVDFNILAVVNRANVEHPPQLLRWLADHDLTNLQFIPCAEPSGDDAPEGTLTEESITSEQYGRFLVGLFDAWSQIGTDRVRIRWFDNLVQMLLGYPNEMCQLAEKCGYIVLEHNGDCYPCDFFVEPGRLLGNIHEAPLHEMVRGEKFQRFSQSKGRLHLDCLDCRWRVLCQGECPRYRMVNTGKIEHELPFFCSAYKYFYRRRYQHLERIAIRIGERMGLAVSAKTLSPARRIRDMVSRVDPHPRGLS
jgi:uncharacterized protein